MMANLVSTARCTARAIIGRPIRGSSILVYHRVAKADSDPWNITVSPDEFERQLSRLRNKTVLPLTEFATLHSLGRLPWDAVAITFDDGYACNALFAAPMLESLGYPATFFIVSDAIVRQEEFWWDQLERILHTPGFDYDATVALWKSRCMNGHGLPPRHVGTSNACLRYLWDLLRRLSAEERRRCLIDVHAQLGLKNETRSTHRPMTVAEVRALAGKPLFEIGGHTATHPFLPALTLAERQQEIVSGLRRLEVMAGQPIRSFSYPFGGWDDATRQMVIAAGFECAVAGAHKRVRPGDNLFTLPRRVATDGYANKVWPLARPLLNSR
jgi:peptidoglycan/xylan/chitin deacetylase (PgdA/CDA1 family)